MQTKKIILPAALAVIALLLGFGAAVTFFDSGSGQQQAAPEGLQGYMVSPARKIAVPDLIKGNGASFTGRIRIVTVAVLEILTPSLTLNVNASIPFAFLFGIYV